MQVRKVVIDNFRNKSHLELDFGRRLTILVGENGSGKTTVLDAVSIGLGAVLTLLPKVSGITFKKTDIQQKSNTKAAFTRIRIETFSDLFWDRTERRDKSKNTISSIPPSVGLLKLREFINNNVIDPFNEDKDFILPVYSYYGVSRALLDVPLRRRGFPKTHQRFESLENSLNAISRFKSAFVWFYNKENEEQRLQKEVRDFDAKLPQLETVRNAIIKFFPGVTEPHILLNPLRFAVKMNNEVLDIMQLSDGYKTLLSLVVDLSTRLTLANPKMDNPLLAPATVLIDEIDLHLHPQWQRKIIGDLLNTFPNTQFILTTHSPYILEALNNHLMRYNIKELPFDDPIVNDIFPLSANDVEAYFFDNGNCLNILNREVNLIDDKLIHPFNDLAAVYDRMRDVQWKSEKHD